MSKQLVKTLLYAWAVLLLSAATGRAQTNTMPLGTYSTVIPENISVGNLTLPGGEYQLTLLEGGKYRLGRNDFIEQTGTYTVTGNLVELSNPLAAGACGGKGMYQWQVQGNKLTLSAASSAADGCLSRVAYLTAAAFIKNDPAARDWKSLGPSGGRIYALLANDGKLFAAGDGGGVFVSTDNGQSWRPTFGIKGYTV